MSQDTSLFSLYEHNIKSVGGRSLAAREFPPVRFHKTMQKVIPWSELEAKLQPYYFAGTRGRPPFPLKLMWRLYLLALLPNYSDDQVLYEVCTKVIAAPFCEVDPTVDDLPERTVLVRFRQWLKEQGLASYLAAAVASALASAGLELKRGTSVDSTLIAASGSTKNKAQSRDPEMSSTRQGNQYHFGMKVPIGTDSETGRVHATDCTTASVHDSQVLGCLWHGDEHEVYGDKAYVGQGETIQAVAPEATDKTLEKAYRNRPLTAAQEESNRAKNRVRAKAEPSFRVLKCQFKYRRASSLGRSPPQRRRSAGLCLLIGNIR